MKIRNSPLLFVCAVVTASTPSLTPFFAQETLSSNPPETRASDRPRESAPRSDNAPRSDETPELARQRVLAPYIEMVPDLSEDQKTHILAILEAVEMEGRAVRANKTLSATRQRNAGRAIRAEIPNRIKAALTDAQLPLYQAQLEEQAQNLVDMDKIVTARPDEDFEQMRARITKGYEIVLEELSVKQKTALIKILEIASEEAAKNSADTELSAAQKSDTLQKIHADVHSKVLPLLDAEQKTTWKKAHDAKKPL